MRCLADPLNGQIQFNKERLCGWVTTLGVPLSRRLNFLSRLRVKTNLCRGHSGSEKTRPHFIPGNAVNLPGVEFLHATLDLGEPCSLDAVLELCIKTFN